MRTYWLSFVDPHREAGKRFQGVVIVDVDEDTYRRAYERVVPGHPDREEAAWLMAALYMTHRARVNPGGAVQASRIDHEDPIKLASLPRLTLLDEASIVAYAGGVH